MLKAIIVDNNPRTRSLLNKLLEDKFSIEVKSYDFIKISISLIKYFNPSILFIDQPFPQLEGYEFLKQIKLDNDTKSIPVVVMLNALDRKYISSLADLGIYQILFKPYNLEEIIPKLDDFFYKCINNNEIAKTNSINKTIKTICIDDTLRQLDLLIDNVIKETILKKINLDVIVIRNYKIASIPDNLTYKCNYTDSMNNYCLSLSLIASEQSLINLYSKIEKIKADKLTEQSLLKCKDLGIAIYKEILKYLKKQGFNFIKDSEEINFNYNKKLQNNHLSILLTFDNIDLFAFTLNYKKTAEDNDSPRSE